MSYDDHGAKYVGLARGQDIGNSLREHTKDHLSKEWERFSWFGFRRVLTSQEFDDTQRLGKPPTPLLTTSDATIRDIEALLIQALGTYRLGNLQQMRFASADRWEQIPSEMSGHLLDKVRSTIDA